MRKYVLLSLVLIAALAVSEAAIAASATQSGLELPPIHDAMAPHRISELQTVVPWTGQPVKRDQRILALPPIQSPYAPRAVVVGAASNSRGS